MTCWRRLRDWQEAGVWERIRRTLLGEMRAADPIDWSRAVADSASLRALKEGAHTGPNPTDRARRGSKHHLLTDAKGLPLAFTLTAANRHDVTQLLPLVDQVPPIAGKPVRPRRRPDCVQGDRAYDSQPHRRERRRRGTAVLAHREAEHGGGLGTTRWVVERSLSWPHQFRRLRVRWERRADIHQAFLALACILIGALTQPVARSIAAGAGVRARAAPW